MIGVGWYLAQTLDLLLIPPNLELEGRKTGKKDRRDLENIRQGQQRNDPRRDFRNSRFSRRKPSKLCRTVGNPMVGKPGGVIIVVVVVVVVVVVSCCCCCYKAQPGF